MAEKWYVDLLSGNDLKLSDDEIIYKNGKTGYNSALTGEWFEVELSE